MYCGWLLNTTQFFVIPQVAYPRWTVRICLWIPAAVLKTFPQFFHRHLNITFMEFCQGHSCTVSTLININWQTSCIQYSDAPKRLTQDGGAGGWERNPEPQQDAHLRCLSCSISRLVIGRHWEWHYSTGLSKLMSFFTQCVCTNYTIVIWERQLPCQNCTRVESTSERKWRWKS